MRDHAFSREGAEILALRLLTHVLGDARLLPALVAQTGLGANAIRAGAGDAIFLAGIVDFIAGSERWIAECAAALDVEAEAFAAARRALAPDAPFD